MLGIFLKFVLWQNSSGLGRCYIVSMGLNYNRQDQKMYVRKHLHLVEQFEGFPTMSISCNSHENILNYITAVFPKRAIFAKLFGTIGIIDFCQTSHQPFLGHILCISHDGTCFLQSNSRAFQPCQFHGSRMKFV